MVGKPARGARIALCPFCGNKNVDLRCRKFLWGYIGVDEQAVERHTWSARCNKCHARGPTVGGFVVRGYDKCRPEHLKHDDRFTDDIALSNEALERWNKWEIL